MNTFEFKGCSKDDVQIYLTFNKMVFDPSLFKHLEAGDCRYLCLN